MEAFTPADHLFRQLAAGDDGAFRALFDHYHKRFYATALKMTRSADLAEEIVQQVFVWLWEERERFAAIARPEAYVFTVVYHHIHAHFRKVALDKKLCRELRAQPVAPETSADEWLGFREREKQLAWAVSQLPAQQQVVYQMSRTEGLCRAEIARRLDISPHTVKNHLLRALRYLRDQVNKATCILF